MDDQTAITHIKQGDLAGLETLVQRYQVRAVHAAYLIVADLAQAEDIAQAAFIKAAERIQQFDEARPFAPWLYRIVINDALKAARTNQRSVSLEQCAEEGVTARIAQYLKSAEQLPEQQIEQQELRSAIVQAIHRLPPEERVVITMQYYLQMRQEDMATRLQRPLTTIKWWLHDARKRLRILLEDLW